MLYLVSYDIIDNAKRIRLAKKLQDYGQRVQYSVFECSLDA
ncbi:MAG TPA: CRISPR-associated endonuclease Cas2, partial [bacterium]|nr:CRISPR-associated endonuclease Cas2 [bacterium]